MPERLYTESEVLGILTNLANGISLYAKGDYMPERYKQKMKVNGKERWVTGRTLKDLLEGYLELCLQEGTVVPGFLVKTEKPQTPLFGDYLKSFYKLYKTKQQSLTKETRERNLKLHILPRFGNRTLDSLKTEDFQEWFNELEENGYSHETIMKIKNIMNPALEAATEDHIIIRNPLQSTRLTIGGKETEHHKAIPTEKMQKIRENIPEISDVRIRCMLALLCFTGMRLEEVLGLRWEDIDFDEGWIHIQRAVVHPGRNKPEVKDPKSKTSNRRIPLPNELIRYLKPRQETGFILYSYSDQSRETPMSFTESRRVFQKIRDEFELQGYSAHDFRDTCATEWREAGIPVDVIAHLLGHSKSDITENRYVKYRDELYSGVREVMNGPKENKTADKTSGMRSEAFSEVV